MRWNQGTAIGRVDTKDALVILRDGATLQTNDFSSNSLTDLLRSSLTIGVSALDRYVHERVVKNVVKALKRSNLNSSQRDFSISAALAIRMAGTIASARNGRERGRRRTQVRPANEIRKAIQDLLHKRPLQSWREIQYAFELIGIQGFDGKIQAAYHLRDISPLRSRLNKIVERRNFIVHEGDLIRHERGGQVKRRPLARKYVADTLDFLDSFVRHLDGIR